MAGKRKYTQEEHDFIVEKWNIEGWTMQKIATELKVSKGSLAGYIHRSVGFRGRRVTPKPVGSSPPKKTKRGKVLKPKPSGGIEYQDTAASRLRKAIIEAPAPAGCKPLMEVGVRECRWAYGDRDYVFCCKPTINKTNWCEEHYNIVYAKETNNDTA